MPSTVVVSVQYAGGLQRDLELPVDVPVATLAVNVAQAIQSISDEEDVRGFKCMLRRLGTGEVLKREHSLSDYAVMHGETLELIRQALPTRAVEVDEQPRFKGPGFIDSTGLRFKIEENRILVGRANPDSGDLDPCVGLDLTAVDTVEAPSICERQAEIRFHADHFFLRDIAGQGGTIVNLKQLEPNKPVKLRHGDHVSFGDVKLVFVWDGRNAPSI
jgi:uncharacterized ubiquitin-like protein YukD